MIKKVTIDNFMAHRHTELEFGPGVTVLTGPNNTGKSAVVEGLRCLATNPDRNPNPALYIRHGAKEARVEVEMEDGTRVAWVRAKRWSMYELWHPGAEEPEEYHKLQRKVPEDIQKVLRLNQVDLETSPNRPVDIHIGNQRDPVFLLNRPDSDAAAFFAASTESAHLLAMQDVLKMRVRDSKREEEALLAETDRIENDLDELESLPSLGLRLESAREMDAEAARLERAIPVLESALTQSRSLHAALDVRERGAGVLAGLDAPPQTQDTRSLAAILAALGGAAHHLAVTKGTSSALDPLENPPVVEDTARLSRAVDALSRTDSSLGRATAQHGAVVSLETPPVPENTAKMAAFLNEYIALQYRSARMGRWTAALGEIEPPPVLESDGPLRSLLGGMHSLTARIQAQETALDGLETDLRNVVDRITERVTGLGRCPTCGQTMDAAHFLDHGGHHDA